MNEIKRFSWNGLYGMEELPDGDYVLNSDHEAEVARLRAEVEKIRGYEVAPLEAKVAGLRAELQKAAKAALDAVALSCEKEREADALRVDAMRYRWLRERASSDRTQICHYGTNWSWNLLSGESADKTIDVAMGESA